MSADNPQNTNLETGSEIETEIETLMTPYSIMIVLVDDQPMIAEMLRRMLDGEDDIDFHYCMDGNDALNTILDIHPTLILQDLVMPNADGLELVRRYRTHEGSREIPIIVLTATDDPETKARAFAVGANDYIVKLPDRLELLARIRYHSQWYIHKLQRDDAYRSLQESQRRLRELNLSLMHLSTHDSLTDIPNRYHFDQVYGNEWRRTGREKAPLSIIMIDIDFFKKFNDEKGHQAGDECLINVADILQHSLNRPGDMVARYGGEEFITLLPNTDTEGAMEIAKKMQADLQAAHIPHPSPDSLGGQVTISLGIATTVPDKNGQPDLLLLAADDALYQAKENGRNRIEIANLADKRKA